ncbi:hypothetical protein D3C72_2491040 [compost metagenome]
MAAWVVFVVMSIVYPSPGAVATAVAAMKPLAPGRFSTTTDCPVWAVMVRAM